MEEDIKKGLQKLVRHTESKVAGSLLKWRYKKEGKKIPDDGAIERQSRQVADQAHQIISRRGKNIWNAFIKASAYREKKDEGDKRD